MEIIIKFFKDTWEIWSSLGGMAAIIALFFLFKKKPNKKKRKVQKENNNGDVYPTMLYTSKEFALSSEATEMLKTISKSSDGIIVNIEDNGGVYLEVSSKNLIQSQDPRNVAKWISAFEEILQLDYISDMGASELYKMTKKGYDFVDKL